MHPFGKKLSTLRRENGISQKQLALAMRMDQTYLCAIEAGRKTVPRSYVFFMRIREALKLSQEEADALTLAALQSQRRYVIPTNASEDEYRLVNKLMARVGSLQAAQIAALSSVLEI
jgi:transcriptional regulator with XRE-family HTH domain